MRLYTNSKAVKDLVEDHVMTVKVHPFDNCVPEDKDVDLVLLD